MTNVLELLRSSGKQLVERLENISRKHRHFIFDETVRIKPINTYVPGLDQAIMKRHSQLEFRALPVFQLAVVAAVLSALAIV